MRNESPYDKRTAYYVDSIRAFALRNGHTFPPCNTALGRWVARRRSEKKNGKISAKKIQMLEKIPEWEWSRPDGFLRNVEHLRDYMLAHGNTPPPNSYVKDHSKTALGPWCSSMRFKKRRGELSVQQIKELEAVNGWQWNASLPIPRDEQWKEKFYILRKYATKHGHPPAKSYSTNSGMKLGVWCSNQRSAKRKGVLREKRLMLLEGIPGWWW